MKWIIPVMLLLQAMPAAAQFSAADIHSPFVLYERRVAFDRNMREQTIKAAFAQPLDSNTEDQYLEACWAVSQFLLRSSEIEQGFRKMFANYQQLDISTKQALLEAVYGTYPKTFRNEERALSAIETVPKLFAMQAVYLYRAADNAAGRQLPLQLLSRRFPDFAGIPVLAALQQYLEKQSTLRSRKTPPLEDLVRYRAQSGQKTIYSFQRWNRNYPGLAIIQLEDGTFARDSSGRLLVFRQLARSASDLPYFITNGSTPQGIYSIQGTAVSHNNLIGPTPNIQLVMPGEADSIFWHNGFDSTKTNFENYLSLLPPSWRNYAPMTESFQAGTIGRSEIIAHGTTIDPEYFKDQPYYPLTPTMGCLCARETWNLFNGKILESEQLRLVNTFLSTPVTTGYLIVINLDDEEKEVGEEEVRENLKI